MLRPAHLWLVLLSLSFPFLSRSWAQTLQCPSGDYLLYLPAGACEMPVYYDSLMWSYSGNYLEVSYFPPEGALLEAGAYPATLTVLTPDSVALQCAFSLVIEHDPAYSTLFCRDLTVVVFDGVCERTVTPGMVLEPPHKCLDVYTLELYEGTTYYGDVLPITAGTWVAKVTDPQTGNACWGFVTPQPGDSILQVSCPDHVVRSCIEDMSAVVLPEPVATSCFDIAMSYSYTLPDPDLCDDGQRQAQVTWIISDAGGNVANCTQLVTFERMPADSIAFPPDYDGTELPAFSCADPLIQSMGPAPALTGEPHWHGYTDLNVGCDYTFSYSDEVTSLCGAGVEITRSWLLLDWCAGTTQTHFQTIRIEDDETPQLEGFEYPLVFSLAAGCADTIVLPAALVADCSETGVAMYASWGDTLAQNGGAVPAPADTGVYELTVVLTDSCGHTATSVWPVAITDRPGLFCPEDRVVDCETWRSELAGWLNAGWYQVADSILGLPEPLPNCSASQVLSQNFSWTEYCLPDGPVVRTIETPDTTCVQLIEVAPVPFVLPAYDSDQMILCKAQLDAPSLNPLSSCGPVSASLVNETLYPVVADACYWVYQEWVFVDSCLYDPDGPAQDSIAPDGRLIDGGDGLLHVNILYRVIDHYDPYLPPDFDLVPDTVPLDANCDPDLPELVLPDEVDCRPENLTIGQEYLPLGNTIWPEPGTYVLSLSLMDMCGNASVYLDTFTIVNYASGPPACKPLVNIELGTADQLPVVLSPVDLLEDVGCPNFFQFVEPDVYQLVLSCNDVGTSMSVVVAKADGSTCTSQVTVTDQSDACASILTIAGEVRRPDGLPIGMASVQAFANGALVANYITQSDGLYTFSLSGGIVPDTIRVQKQTNPMNGVSTYDLVLISKHILQVHPLDDPWAVWAADANGSGTVTTSDMVAIRKVILNIEPAFPNGVQSWQFFPGNIVFGDPNNPWGSISYDPDADPYDFIGIKTGDVNMSNQPDFSAPADDRGLLPFPLRLEAVSDRRVALYAGASGLEGFQGALRFPPGRVHAVVHEGALTQPAHLNAEVLAEGRLLVSWNAADGRPAPTALPLLLFETDDPQALVESMALDQMLMPAEAIVAGPELRRPVLERGMPSGPICRLSPNPAAGPVWLELHLPEAQELRWSVWRADGVRMSLQEQTVAAGAQRFALPADALTQPGLYLVRVEGNGWQRVMRLVVLK